MSLYPVNAPISCNLRGTLALHDNCNSAPVDLQALSRQSGSCQSAVCYKLSGKMSCARLQSQSSLTLSAEDSRALGRSLEATLDVQEASSASNFNTELLYGIALAWGEACDCLRDMLKQGGPAGRIAPEQLYSIIPGTETMAAESALAQSDAWLSKEIAANVSAFCTHHRMTPTWGCWTLRSLCSCICKAAEH